MTDDLATKLAVLTDDVPEPMDPVAPVRLRISRRRRRRGAAAVVATAAVTAAALAAFPLLTSLRATEPGVAGFAPPIPVQPTGDHTTVMPAPWSAEKFTTQPDAGLYRPQAYYIARGTLPTESFAVLAFSRQGCLVTQEGPANNLGRQYVCFDNWQPGQRGAYQRVLAYTQKNGAIMPFTLIIGAVSADARSVRIISAGKTYVTDAVGTPATDRLRFFSVLIPVKNADITTVAPLNASGRAAAAPVNPPKPQPCNQDCGRATPTR
ncbi:hypothetical protein PWY87_02890 [Kribbella solani]|uniref:hypothetical protein n=1 Tax=Kribbella solani TaxID=236067 RepID=UPI0029A3CF37|nr:hypothetical protein [Kribbella solani]MDX2972958.1 hypothetical protein [Kribbella solani]MDX3000602.1 hypothetical protein [Kribbella solani]